MIVGKPVRQKGKTRDLTCYVNLESSKEGRKLLKSKLTLDTVLAADGLVLVVVAVNGAHLDNAMQVLSGSLVVWGQAIDQWRRKTMLETRSVVH